jgi:predicted AAA+ superfamily ATPase
MLKERSWDRKKEVIIFDEIHKMKNWKSFLKGIYDVERLKNKIIVTGSAKLDTIRKTGDSLAGRYFQFRLHPFDLAEVKNTINPKSAFERILEIGGFPEPFLKEDLTFYRRWTKSHLDIILRHDLIDYESVKNIQTLETLIELLKYRVGSPISYASLSRDLSCDPKTVKRWLRILETLYLVFPVRPFHRNIARSILKEPKYYFYDTGLIKGDIGTKIENLTACSLLKRLNLLEDCLGYEVSLNYLKNKDGKEIDFLVSIEGNKTMIEVKSGDRNLSKNFKIFSKYFPQALKIQLVYNLDREKTFPDGCEMRDIATWLSETNNLQV